MSNRFLSEVNEKEEVKGESFKKEKFEAIKPDRTKYFILAGIIVLALVGFFIISNPKVTMTSFEGWTLSDAQAWASSNQVQLVVTEKYSEIEAQTVLSQSIAEGEKIDAKSSVEVEVSLGFDPKEVISLPTFDETWTKTKILNWIEENGIENYSFLTIEDENLAASTFVSYKTPETVDAYIREHAIEFTVSILPVVAEVTVVDLLNYSTAQIDAWAKDNELKVIYKTAFSETVAVNKVVSQSISSGDSVTAGSSITVTLSKGPAVTMVDFSTYDQTAASVWAKENAIDLTVSTQYSSTVAKGVAIYQSIPKGSVVEQGADLSLVYSLGSEISLSSFVGQAYTSLQAFVEAQNALGASLTLSTSNSYSTTVAINKVIAQSAQDARVSMGSTITVVVSLGDLSIVPDVLALNTDNTSGLVGSVRSPLEMFNDVSTLCTSADVICQITFSDVDDLDASFGTVLSQSILKNTEVSDTTVLQVVIAE